MKLRSTITLIERIALYSLLLNKCHQKLLKSIQAQKSNQYELEFRQWQIKMWSINFKLFSLSFCSSHLLLIQVVLILKQKKLHFMKYVSSLIIKLYHHLVKWMFTFFMNFLELNGRSCLFSVLLFGATSPIILRGDSFEITTFENIVLWDFLSFVFYLLYVTYLASLL